MRIKVWSGDERKIYMELIKSLMDVCLKKNIDNFAVNDTGEKKLNNTYIVTTGNGTVI
jgi:hypothetical protein